MSDLPPEVPTPEGAPDNAGVPPTASPDGPVPPPEGAATPVSPAAKLSWYQPRRSAKWWGISSVAALFVVAVAITAIAGGNKTAPTSSATGASQPTPTENTPAPLQYRLQPHQVLNLWELLFKQLVA